MKRLIMTILAGMLLIAFTQNEVKGQSHAPVDPVSQGTWILSFGVGPGNHYFGNGIGFGPGFDVSFEGALWQVGPGVFTIGGEMGFSFFANNYVEVLDVKYSEHWINWMIGARSAYHYGFGVKGLDCYAGMPLGVGFSSYTYDDYKGEYHGHQPVFPYVGFFVGTSYWFNRSLGINGELGFNVTYAQLGMVFKLK